MCGVFVSGNTQTLPNTLGQDQNSSRHVTYKGWAKWFRNTNTADPDGIKLKRSTLKVSVYPGFPIHWGVNKTFSFYTCVCVTWTCPMLEAAMNACCTTLLFRFCSVCAGSELQSCSSRYCRISAWPLRAAWTTAHCPLLSTWSTWYYIIAHIYWFTSFIS